MRQEKASHKIFIRSNTFCDNKEEDEDRDDKSIISVGQDKDEIEEIITSCLEEPLHEMLQKWSEDLKRVCFTENASDVIAEIEALRNKLLPTISKKTDVPCTGTGTIVPENVKDYLFRLIFFLFFSFLKSKRNMSRWLPLTFCCSISSKLSMPV